MESDKDGAETSTTTKVAMQQLRVLNRVVLGSLKNVELTYPLDAKMLAQGKACTL